MFKAVAGIAWIALPIPLAAQSIPAPHPNPNFRWSDPGLGSVSNVGPAQAYAAAPENPRECLMEKASRKTVCHTRDEWRMIAERMRPPEGR